MAGCQFVFDVVVSHFEPTAIVFKDPKRLVVDVQFNNKGISITSSRINVTEFRSTAGLEFVAVPKKLRKTLEDCGMPITVKYNDRPVGTGQISFPQMIIDRIEDGMSDLMHADSCTFEKDGTVLGTLELLCRLVIKCEEQPMGESVCKRNMDKSIGQHDIMFVMAESQRCPNSCDPCADALEPEEGDEQLKLDLQRYRSHTDGLKSDQVFSHTPAGNAACCEIKKMAQECEDIVDSITKAAGHPKPLKAPCRKPDDLSSPCLITDLIPIEENPLTSPNYPCFSYLPARIGDSPDFCNANLIPVPISDLEKPMVKPSRFCPICLNNMSWLPKFAACPKCGVKPMPVVEDRHKDKALTADSIMTEFLGKPKGAAEDFCVDPCNMQEQEKDKEDEAECRCTCKLGKLCAHCRIRKLVADIFQASKKEKVCPKVKPNSSEDFCVMENSTTECRPFLSRVFSELRDLYDLKDAKLQGESDKPVSRLPDQKETSQTSRLEKPKTATIQEPKKIVKREHQSVERKRKPFGAGHKFCVNSQGHVAHHHGWAWHLRSEASKHGWRPGSVRKSVKKLMDFFLHYSKDKTPLKMCEKEQEAEREKERQLPTLNMCKKDGAIFVTLRAINDKNVEMKPITFKIVKSPLAVAMSQIKKKLKAKGFPKCCCHQSLMMCVCRSQEDKKRLEQAVAQESRRLGFESCVDKLVLSDTSDSELEFDFDVSPPAASAPPTARAGKQLLRNRSTQTLGKKEPKVVPKYPRPTNVYTRTYDCAAGDRYTGTALGAPGETPFEDGVFGFRGGGPHGVSATPGGKAKVPGIWGASPGGPMRGGGRVGSGSKGGGGAGGQGGPGGPGGPGGAAAFGGKSFPGAKKVPGSKDKSPPIPVRMTDRYKKGVAAAKKAEKDKIKAEIAHKKKGTNLIKYLEAKGTVPTPWDPNNPKPKGQKKPEPERGPDGLTDAERRRRDLCMRPIPPLDSMPRLGKCPGSCYNPCHGECCYPCTYFCP